MYKTGDLARYRPDGVIEYLGRIDHQVKIRGFRIELGEIETRLKQYPGVRDTVVLAREDSPGDKRLVAYLVSVQAPEVEELRAWLVKTLPDYMVPAAFVHLERLPVTANGKLDRKALPAPDLSAQFAEHYVAPRNATEETLAKIWAEVLRVERVGIHDNFFELGGDSILGIQAVSRATRAGSRLSPRQLFQHPTIAALAQVAEPVFDAKTDPDDVCGELPLTPIQHWFVHQSWANPDHWNQALLLEMQRPLEARHLEKAVRQLVRHHDALRLHFVLEQGVWRQFCAEEEHHRLILYEDLSQTPEAEMAQAIAGHAAWHQAQLSLGQGPLFRAIHFDVGPRHRGWLLLIAHHLTVDAVSWSILLEDLDTLCRQWEEGREPALPPKTTSYRRWALRLSDYAQTLAGAPQPPRPIGAPLRADDATGVNTETESSTLVLTLEAAQTRALVQESAGAYRTHVPELLLAALGQVIGAWAGNETVLLDLEGHGRDHPFDNLDLTRTVGWFTTLFPVSLGISREGSPGTLVKAVKEQVRRSAGAGFDYSVRRWLLEDPAPAATPRASILFNYLGHLDPPDDQRARFRPVFQPAGALRDPRNARVYEWEITAAITGGRLRLEWTYSAARYARATVEELAGAAIQRLKELIAHCQQPEAGGLTPVDFPLARLSQGELDALPCAPRNIEDIYPLAPMQEGLLFHTLMHPGSGIYHMQDRYGIQGQVDVEAFREAWQRVLDRHPILRSTFVWEGLGSPHQVVNRRVALPFEFVDWRQFTQSEQASMLEELLHAERKQGFDLARAPLMRIRLVRLAEDRYRLIRSHHHILIDAWCTSLMLQDFKDCYQALREGQRAPERIVPPFKDYIAWLQRQDRAAAERFWREYLRGFTEATPMVVDRSVRHPADGGEIGDQVDLLSEDETAALSALAQRHRLTVNTFVQAAWALLLSRYSRCEEVLFGITVAGRPTDLPGIEMVLGLFINSLPLRVRVHPGQRVLDFLGGLLQQNLDLRQYEHLPLVQIQASSDIPRGQPLFQHLLVFENTPLDPGLREDCAGLRLVDVENRTHTNYPLTVVVIPGPRLHLQLTYERVRFENTAIARMLGHFRCLLEGLIHHPEARLGELGMLTEAERRTVFFTWNQTALSKPAVSDFPTLFEAQQSRTPEAVAVACGGEQLTYRGLSVRANRIAHALIARGVGPDVLVALVDERGIDLLVAILAVFKAGGAYLPIDPAYPPARIEHIVETSRAALVMTGPSCSVRIREAVNAGDGPKPPVVSLGELEAEQATERSPIPHGNPRDLAYVIYTSGSTGAPKGAMVERAGMLNNLLSKISEFNLGPGDVIAETASQCFDISVWQFLAGLVCGARVEIIPNAVVQDPGALLDTAAARGVTVLELVPSLIGAVLDETHVALGRLRWLLPTGEAFPVAICRRWMERYPEVSLLNAYGPAECSDDVAYHRITAPPQETESRIPIGRPLPNLRLSVLDDTLQPVPVGVPGELCVAGIGVGRGYLGRPDLTAQVFVPDPFRSAGEDGGRLYRTGDLACYRPDSTLEYLGRIDHQVKVRGFRIEPGEIEARLLAHPKVKEAVVLAREDSPGNKRLVAYIVAAPSAELPTSADLRAILKGTLPEYMLPSAFVFLEQLPLNPNGKVDRKRLPALDFIGPSASEHTGPRNATEVALINIWRDVLGIDRFGVHDTFFELGGHSLLAMQVASRMRAAFNIDIPLRKLFETPTVAELSQLVEALVLANLETLSENEARCLLEQAGTVPGLESNVTDDSISQTDSKSRRGE